MMASCKREVAALEDGDGGSEAATVVDSGAIEVASVVDEVSRLDYGTGGCDTEENVTRVSVGGRGRPNHGSESNSWRVSGESEQRGRGRGRGRGGFDRERGASNGK